MLLSRIFLSDLLMAHGPFDGDAIVEGKSGGGPRALQDASRLRESHLFAPPSWSAPSPSAFAARQSAASARRRLAFFPGCRAAAPGTPKCNLKALPGRSMEDRSNDEDALLSSLFPPVKQ